MDLELNGKRAAITGASRGIGRAISLALADEGASTALCARGEAGLQAVLAELEAKGGRHIGRTVDVGKEGEVGGWIEWAAEQLGGLEILVVNASAMAVGGPADSSAWGESYEVDLMHGVHAVEAALPHLHRSGEGAVVYVGSTAAVMPFGPDTLAYGVFKAGILNFASQMAHTHAGDVRVNTVTPGSIDFPGGAWDEIRSADPGLYEEVKATHALGRYGRPEEVAAAVTFLASPRASFITGVNLRVDGGQVKAVDY